MKIDEGLKLKRFMYHQKDQAKRQIVKKTQQNKNRTQSILRFKLISHHCWMLEIKKREKTQFVIDICF